MVEETITLLRDVAANIANRRVAMEILMQRFNDRECSNAIIYHLRILASSWLKGNPASYEPFIPDEYLGIAGYCQGCLEPPDREIEHLGIVLLANVLLKPVNFVLEIAYLDRSPGGQVNIYRYPDEANDQDVADLGPIIYLLYRPDHYDILYKIPTQPVNIQVNRVSSFTHHHDITSTAPSLQSFTTVDFSPLALLPGFGPSGLSSVSPIAQSPIPEAFTSTSQSPWLPQTFPEPLPQAAPPPPPPPPTQLPPPQTTQAPSTNTYPLRFSREMHRLPVDTFPEPTFTTNMFKNSHFNKAHYNNPDFHPEEWTPDDDGPERGSGRKKGRCRE
jgi:ubiquitin thioesterase protein OTUB1